MDLRTILWRLSHEIVSRFPLPKDTPIPEDIDGLLKSFPELVNKAVLFGRIVIVIDGLDHMLDDYGAHSMHWLCFIRQLPTNRIRVIVSANEKSSVEKVFSVKITF